ncbi:unnamed protein product [Trifolium pratense]|uniref:Uncharacterized protein n=1 Tax=Trifolium pratense TaxID=57577 RepID=A0ACB0K8U7_TRIPR|nr:unnamed protein product [Trifolium pratense]
MSTFDNISHNSSSSVWIIQGEEIIVLLCAIGRAKQKQSTVILLQWIQIAWLIKFRVSQTHKVNKSNSHCKTASDTAFLNVRFPTSTSVIVMAPGMIIFSTYREPTS